MQNNLQNLNTSLKTTISKSQNRKYVFSLEQFKVHTQLHVQRVRILGIYISQKYKSFFPNVKLAKLNDFLQIHDCSKWNTSSEFLQKHGYSEYNSETIIERLFQFYNINLSQDMSLESLIEELNQIDQIEALSYFRNNGLVTSTGTFLTEGKEILIIEQMADCIDRQMSPVCQEELGFREFNFEDFFDTQHLQIISEVMKEYNQITHYLASEKYL